MGVRIYSFNLNSSPEMSYAVLECDIMLENDMLMIFNKDFVIKRVRYLCQALYGIFPDQRSRPRTLTAK